VLGAVDEGAVEKLLGIGILVQVAACMVIGGRLLRLAGRTREAPELFLGGAFLLLGAVGYPLSIVARGGTFGEHSAWALLAALGAQDLACICMIVATWRTFHADRVGLWAVCGASLAAVSGSLIAGAVTGSPDAGFAYYVGFAVRMGSFTWAAFESLAYYRRLRRRQRIGLGDPVVLDRFRLWTISTFSIVAGFAVFLGARLLGGNVGTSAVVLLATSAVGVVGGTSMWLAFFPPAGYLRRVGA
jgi:hypothetical protein